MSKREVTVLLSVLTLVFASLACNLGVPKPTPTNNSLPSIAPTASTASTILISPTPSAVATQSAASTYTPIPATNTISAPTLTPTPQNPLVTTTAYCWSGPTNNTLKYEVVSSIQAGTRVQLLGRGIVDGWWIVRDPRYNDPCWIQQQYVQIDPSYDLFSLKTFAVPPTPTATP